MNIDIFKWKVKPGMGIESEPRVRTVRFGDGYEQRRPDGFNTNQKKYSIMLSPKNGDALLVCEFLEKQGGMTVFLWKPPHQIHMITVLCRKWSSSVGALRTEITAEFEQAMM